VITRFPPKQHHFHGLQWLAEPRTHIPERLNMVVKITYKGNTTRLAMQLPQLQTFTTLKELTVRLFPELGHQETLSFSYVDDEGDNITIASDADIQEAVRAASTDASSLRINVDTANYVDARLTATLETARNIDLSTYVNVEVDEVSTDAALNAKKECSSKDGAAAAASEHAEEAKVPNTALPQSLIKAFPVLGQLENKLNEGMHGDDADLALLHRVLVSDEGRALMNILGDAAEDALTFLDVGIDVTTDTAPTDTASTDTDAAALSSTEKQDAQAQAQQQAQPPPVPTEPATTCPQGHALLQFQAEHDNYTCDGCHQHTPFGTTLRGCRTCDFDLCSYCLPGSSGTGAVDGMSPYGMSPYGMSPLSMSPPHPLVEPTFSLAVQKRMLDASQGQRIRCVPVPSAASAASILTAPYIAALLDFCFDLL
jgi:hypothetical protein